MDLFKNIPIGEKIYSIDKYVFKKGDLMQQIPPDNFPEIKDGSYLFAIMDAKQRVEIIVCEKFQDQMNCKYFCEHEDEFYVNLTESTYTYVNNAKKKGSMVAQQSQRLAIMFSLIGKNQIQWGEPIKSYKKGQVINCGKPYFVSVNTRLSKQTDKAYPYFKELEFDKID
jgi:hypothetical protein